MLVILSLAVVLVIYREVFQVRALHADFRSFSNGCWSFLGVLPSASFSDSSFGLAFGTQVQELLLEKRGSYSYPCYVSAALGNHLSAHAHQLRACDEVPSLSTTGHHYPGTLDKS